MTASRQVDASEVVRSTQVPVLWLVRHGDTIWSETGSIAGRTDIELSDTGRARVVRLSSTLPESVQSAKWISSPLKRARETTRLLRCTAEGSEKAHPSVSHSLDEVGEVVFDERLVELDFGDWEGSSWESIQRSQGDVLAEWGEDWVATAPPNGESFQQLFDRCAAWFDEWECTQVDRSSGSLLLDKAVHREPGKTVVVTHGGCIRALLCRLLGWPLNQAMRCSVELACVYRFSWCEARRRWLVRAVNHDSF